ncbi:MAG: hypothetical protein U0992_08455 [Planctomycetaceae bacterium]
MLGIYDRDEAIENVPDKAELAVVLGGDGGTLRAGSLASGSG